MRLIGLRDRFLSPLSSRRSPATTWARGGDFKRGSDPGGLYGRARGVAVSELEVLDCAPAWRP